jgi:hypothetical protein
MTMTPRPGHVLPLTLAPEEMRVLGKLFFEIDVMPEPVLGLTEAEYQTFFRLARRLWGRLYTQQEGHTHE